MIDTSVKQTFPITKQRQHCSPSRNSREWIQTSVAWLVVSFLWRSVAETEVSKDGFFRRSLKSRSAC